MSELTVFVFRDQYRAPEVLNELRRREWEGIADLNETVVVALDEQGHTKVHLSIDLSTGEAPRWAQMWSSLLALTLYLPLTEVIATAADRMTGNGHALTSSSLSSNAPLPDARWWKEALSDDFLRDVGAMIGPGDSAIFMILRAKNLPAALRQLRGYGGTLLHTLLGQQQDEELKAMLSPGYAAVPRT